MQAHQKFAWTMPCVQAVIGCLIVGWGIVAAAADPAKPAAPDPPSSESSPARATERLARDQEQLAAKYKHFEEVLLRMAELTAPTDPKRAALLRKAVAQSKGQLIGVQLEKLVELLEQDRLAVAITNQQEVEQDLDTLLKLLLTEQRSEKLKDEKQRLKEQIRRIKELINKQIQIQAQTEGTGEAQELSRSEGKLADDTGKLAQEMHREQPSKTGTNPSGAPQEAQKPEDGEKKPGDKEDGKAGKPSSGKSSDKKGDSKSGTDDQSDSADGKPKEAKPKSGGDEKQSKPSDKNQPSAEGQGKKSKEPVEPGKGEEGDSPQGKPKQGQPSKPQQGQPGSKPPEEAQENQEQQAGGEQPPQEDQNPGQKRVAAAQEKMEAAQKKLDKAEREGAAKDQEQAVRELEQARAELEEILRQLREEEIGRTLAQLEARFRKMLDMQREVYEGSKRLDRVPLAQRGRGDEIEAGRLSRREALIVAEADRALVVLREEGSAVAMPEAVEQMRDDMNQVVTRLGQAKIDQVTVGIEEDIIAALEELIGALEKAQKKLEENKSPSRQAGEPQEPPLVDRLSELKMIRSLQMRVNTRTKRYAKLVSGDVGETEESDLREALQGLAEREERIYRTTRDIVLGKNQ
jgi:hypothetical protein